MLSFYSLPASHPGSILTVIILSMRSEEILLYLGLVIHNGMKKYYNLNLSGFCFS